MPTLTTQQTAQYAVNAGFTGSALATVVAIAFAESGYDTQAQHVNSDGSIDRGVLQINNKAHPEVNDQCAYNPSCAFQAGWTISQKGQNFGPWTTYSTGTYRKYLTDIIKQIRGVTFQRQNPNDLSGNLGQNSPKPGDSGKQLLLDPLQAAFQPLFNALPMFGIHIALFMFGLMLVIIGLWILTRNPVDDTGSAFNTGLNKMVRGGK